MPRIPFLKNIRSDLKKKKKSKQQLFQPQVSVSQKIYNSQKWKKLRNAYIAENPLCQSCLEKGKIVPAEEIHHVQPFLTGQTQQEIEYLAYSWGNLMALCKKCHHQIHNKAKEEGRWTGGQKLYGYDVNKDNRYIINEEEAEIVRLVFRMYTDENKGTYQIAKIIQAEYGGFRGNKSFESSHTRIRSMLANELYTGQTDYTPQIISPEYFEKTRLKREANRTGVRKKTKHISFCSGILFSKIDGTLFHASVKQHCYINRESGRNLHISYNHIDSLAWHLASAERGGKMSFNAPKESEKLKKELESLKKQLNVINSEIEDISKKYDRVESRFINGKISEDMADELEKKLDKEKEGKEVEKKTIQDKIKSTTLLIKKSATYISGDFATAIKNLNSLDDKSKYEIIHEEIKAIYVEKDEDRKHKFICKVEVEFIEGYTRTFFLNTFNKKIMELWGDGTLHDYPVVIYDRSDYKTAQRGKTFKNRITIEKLK